MIEIENNSEILQVHYYLSENSHSMDALILNKAENEILKIINEISKILDIQIIIETQALEEGGIKSIYKFLNKKKNRRNIAAIGVFIAGIAATTISEVISDNIKTDYEYEKLKKEKLNLEIQKLKKELEEDGKEDISETDIKKIQDISMYISETNKVKISKSNFYSVLLKESKIRKVSTQQLNLQSEPTNTEKIVPRQDFEKFIIESAEIEDDYQEQIALEIISPVLNQNRMKWKAMHNGELITFTLKDKNFKNLIITKNLSFSNGTRIVCDLETKQKMNTEGEIINGAKSVYSVTQIIYNDGDSVDIFND